MDQVISDAKISSCQEIEERRQQEERAALDALERRMREIVRLTMEEEQAIVNEKNDLQQELSNELALVTAYTDLMSNYQDSVRQQLQDMLDTQTQLTNVSVDTVSQLSSLQEAREQNHATLQADPIFALIQEERELQLQLENIGIIVYPPTDSDEHFQ